MLSLDFGDLRSTGDFLDSRVVAELPITEMGRSTPTISSFSKSVDASTCGLTVLQG